MGLVIMTEIEDLQEFNESYEFDYAYTYCDKCGSFDIKQLSRLPPHFDKGLVLITVVSFFGAFALLMIHWRLGCLTGILGLGAFLIGALTTYFKCGKCGNRHLTSDNVLHYVANDKSVFDVSERDIMKQPVNKYGRRV